MRDNHAANRNISPSQDTNYNHNVILCSFSIKFLAGEVKCHVDPFE